MDKVRTIKLQYYTDPSHGWLRISRRDAEFLGILDKISGYSYQSPKGNYIYLEEDSDATIATEALRARTDALPQYLNDRRNKYGRSRIRGLQSYFYPHTTAIYTTAHDLNERLDNLERFIRINIRVSYEIPRPEFNYPWSAEMYYDVIDAAIQLIRQHYQGWCYIDVKRSLIATNDRARMIADHAELAGKLIIKHVK